nr:MAG TPA: hypothetical protein [Caudoviricetes sp.]
MIHRDKQQKFDCELRPNAGGTQGNRTARRHCIRQGAQAQAQHERGC